ncbi:hypothetical protein RvY_14596 [Ramazzottius varieornatus]|uniref:Rad21/Rec8-like protein N-terminal domain-containing protein n=1 Tax=Ramazzottius varieornatus TaxID=947166 RepID=A0A1D1VVN1_RAMVA|nr:hypothetical protein RvY_14596 [Ramazzottius varieornatus]
MFYAHFVLSKKGPLAKVWLAAHWERKLTKAHVFETNIEQTVEGIMHPRGVKLALRTSGHLLLGVVRIYSRKAKYLLQDCNEALGKIKMAFRPVMIDLPAEHRVASKAALTLAVQEKDIVPREYVVAEIDFDLDFEELSDAELKARFASNQAREEDITMKETVYGATSISRPDDNDLLDEFGEYVEDDFVGIGAPQMEEGVAQDNVEDFAAGMMDDDNMDNMAPEFQVIAADQSVPGPAKEAGLLSDDLPLRSPAAVLHVLDAGDVEQMRGNQSDITLPPPGTDNVANDTANVSAAEEPNATANQSALSTVLRPRAGLSIVKQVQQEQKFSERARPIKRKRKLIIDDQKVIPSDQMRQQLQDTSDITRKPEMAPKNDATMMIKENSSIDKLWHMPGMFFEEAPGMSNKLLAIFADQVLPAIADNSEGEDFFPASFDVDVLRHSVNMRSMQDLDFGPVDNDIPVVPEQQFPEEAEAPMLGPSGRSKRAKVVSTDADDSTLNQTGTLGQPDIPNPDMPVPELEQPAEAGSRGKEVSEQTNAEEEEEEDAEGEESHPEDRGKMSKKTYLVFERFAGLLNRRHTPRHSKPDSTEQSVNFKDLIRGHQTRKEVAQQFYSILVLKKLRALDVEQSEPYADIWLQKGDRFDKFKI